MPDRDLSQDGRVLFVMATPHEYGEHLRALFTPVITGIGPIEAAIGTSLALHKALDAGRRPELVVSLGSAGSRRLPVGSVWQVSGVSWRDMDASRLGFDKGVTPFSDHPAVLPLPTPLDGVGRTTLSTGSDIVGGEAYDAIEADLVDMETFAVVRACQRFDVPVVGLRGVSDGDGDLNDLGGWTGLLHLLDERLAHALEDLPAALERLAQGADAA